MKLVETRVFTITDLRSAAGAEGKKASKLSGHAALYNERTDVAGLFVEVIKPGAFRGALDGKDDVRALFNHNPDLVLGRTSAKTLRLGEDARGLTAEIDLPDTTVARDLSVSVDRGDVSQMSFQFSVRQKGEEWVQEKTTDGVRYWVRTLTDVELYDVSPVTFPQYEKTDVVARSARAAFDAAGNLRSKVFDIRASRLRGASIALAALAISAGH